MAAAVGRPLRAALRRHEQRLLLALAAAVLCATSVAPLAGLFVREGADLLRDSMPLFGSGTLALLLRSLVLSTLVTLLALALGLPLGVLVGRTEVRGWWAASLLHAFPAFLPPFLLALGWFHVFGVSGLLGSEATSRALFSDAGFVIVLALAFTPIATSLVALGVQGVDPALEEAGRVVAKPLRVMSRILVPAAAPAWILAAIVIFTLSFSELGVPMFLRVDTFPAMVFSRLGGVDYAPGEALGLVLPLVPLALLLLAAERRFVGTRSFAVFGLRSGRQDRLALGRWTRAASVALWIAALLSVAPIATLTWRALSGGGAAEAGRWMGRAPWNSLSSSGVAATAIVGLGLVVGHAAARRLPGAAVLDAAAVLSFVAPAAVLGIGMIGFWNRPGLQWVYGTSGMLVVGYVARYAVVGVRTIGSLVAQTPLHVEGAAAAVGAGFWRRLTRILLPLHARGIGFAWLLALVFCLRDLELAVLYYPPGGEPLTVRLFTLEANGPEPVVAALAVVHVTMTAAVLSAGGFLLGRRATT
jgi:iron(III) transport system permease protein